LHVFLTARLASMAQEQLNLIQDTCSNPPGVRQELTIALNSQ
jgi:hypothetical protein